jgi:hypothetical protein
MRVLTNTVPVTDIREGMALVVQGAIVETDGSHRSIVASIRSSKTSVWLTFTNGTEIRYRKTESVNVERVESKAYLTGKPTNTNTDVTYRVPNVYGHRR